MPSSRPLIVPFSNLSLDDLALVGGKNASLGELARSLPESGPGVPDGFAVTTAAFKRLMDEAGLRARVLELLDGLDKRDPEAFAARGHALRQAVLDTPLPDELADAIRKAYRALGKDVPVAVRSSATAEDLPGLSFAGQHESFLHVRGEDALLDACQRCFASLYTDRALSYRIDRQVDHASVALSIGVQRMVMSDDAVSGVMFTLDTETGSRQSVLVNAVYGNGEAIVQGVTEPDEYSVHKATYAEGFRAVHRHKVGRKHVRTVAGERGEARTEAVPEALRQRYCLNDEEVLELAGAAMAIEAHYSAFYGQDTPMDIEWAKDAGDGKLYILQARPETVQALAKAGEYTVYKLEGSGPTLTSGIAIGKKIGAGTARLVRDRTHLGAFEDGDILVTETTSPDWEPLMKRASALVTDHGGRTCHSAIVARELGLPAVVGTGDGTSAIKDGEPVTVNCADGETGKVLAGIIPVKVTKTDTSTLERPRTKVMLNVADPGQAFQLGMLPSDGVGLARIEFIITHAIGVHPMALLHPDKVEDSAVRTHLQELSKGFASGQEFFVQKLAEGVATIAAAFHPRPVIVRLSDFKSNEYAALLGGGAFEPAEENPMIGFRGAVRYTHPDYAEAFKLECAALKLARETMGFSNIKIMVPFCRTVEEADRVLDAMAQNGIKRGKNGLEVYVMCEIPSNVLSVDLFARRFDGFSIGSNDLTQLVLGTDRDSDRISGSFDERNPAVLKAITMAVEGAHLAGTPIGICGQAPSDYPDFTRFLVEKGVDSISVTSDSLLEMLGVARQAEQDLVATTLADDIMQ